MADVSDQTSAFPQTDFEKAHQPNSRPVHPGGYTFRPTCSCGWQGRLYGDDHAGISRRELDAAIKARRRHLADAAGFRCSIGAHDSVMVGPAIMHVCRRCGQTEPPGSEGHISGSRYIIEPRPFTVRP